MKAMKFLAMGMLFLGMTFLTSCKKEQDGCLDVNATNYNANATNHVSSLCTYNQTYTTGNLIVNVRDGVGNSVTGYYVYLYANNADYINRIYTSKQKTNNSGQVTFTNLSPAVYYVDCDYETVSGSTVTVKGSGAVSAGYETTITIKP